MNRIEVDLGARVRRRCELRCRCSNVVACLGARGSRRGVAAADDAAGDRGGDGAGRCPGGAPGDA